LHDLAPVAGSVKERKRVGRGPASGQGKTAGKGHKGQKARAGAGPRIGFEGGQMPLQRRVPKRGFNNIFRKEYAIINIGTLEEAFDAGAVVDYGVLREMGLLRKPLDGLKILGEGAMTKSLTVRATKFSASAKAAIEAAGGTAEVV
jgi:large subunit ribosomal protein L15